jgi:elongation factor Ts
MDSKDIMRLKNTTNAGIKDCQEALTKCDGNFEKAIAYLREKGKSAAIKKADRVAAEGAVGVYTHHGRIGVMVEINCETDFAAKNELFQNLLKDVAMQIAASNPLYLDETSVPTKELEKEKEVLRNKARAEKKPEAIIEKMLEGQVKKFYSEMCLLYQPFIKDPSKTVKDVVTEVTAGIGEKVSIRRFVRFELGEGIEKKSENFADEVAKAASAGK